MKPNTVIAPIRVDRLATAEEIRAAIVPSHDPIDECAAEILHAIDADLRGYVGIPSLDFEASWMIEELTQNEDEWVN